MNYSKTITNEMGQQHKVYKVGKIITHSIIGLLLVITFFSSFVLVGAGKRGVVLRMGAVSDRILNEGFNFKAPWIEKVVRLDVTTQKEEKVDVDAASKDLQNVTTNVAINYHLDTFKVNKIYQVLRKEYSERVIQPTIEEFVKKTTAEYTAEQLITKRAEVKENLKNGITEKLAENNIIVENVFITNFQFSAQFDLAIEAKVTAEQEALQAKNVLEKVRFEAEQRVAQAEAEAEAIRLQSNAAQNPKYIELKKIEAEVKAIEKWNGVLPATFVPGSALPFINLNK